MLSWLSWLRISIATAVVGVAVMQFQSLVWELLPCHGHSQRNFIETQTHLFIYMLSTVAFMLQWQHFILVTETTWAHRAKHIYCMDHVEKGYWPCSRPPVLSHDSTLGTPGRDIPMTMAQLYPQRYWRHSSGVQPVQVTLMRSQVLDPLI